MGYLGKVSFNTPNTMILLPLRNSSLFGCHSFNQFSKYLSSDFDKDNCKSSPCYNGATCIDDDTTETFKCICAPGWKGTRCRLGMIMNKIRADILHKGICSVSKLIFV